MTVHVRRATASDADGLPAIERSAGALFRTIPELAWIADDGVMSADAHRDIIARGASWVAETDAGPMGFLASEYAGDAVHVLELAVHADHQGLGAGRALMAAAIAHARSQRCTAVTLTTFRDVAWNEAFYARLGFVTLEGAALDSRLTALLEREAQNGLPRERRCAMRLAL